jgi:RNA polymerase sigma-70 factor, ECF subfamily
MDTPTTSFDLIERFRRGDPDAFTPLFEKYRRRLAVMIHYKLRPDRRQPEDVEDILQETFYYAFRNLSQFQYLSRGSFLNWLSRISDNVIIDSVRRQNRQKRRVDLTRFRSETHPFGAEPADSDSPSRILTEREELKALIDTLNSLPEQYRQVILLAKIEGLSTVEIAERLGKSRENVALLLHRAIQRLRTKQDSE